MAVLESLRSLFVPTIDAVAEIVVPAPPTEYKIKPLTMEGLSEVLRLNIRCFRNGDNYTKHTFNYLLTEPRTLSYRVVNEYGVIAAFAFVMVNENNAAHLTTIGVAPEHRRRGIAKRLLDHIEDVLRKREVGTLMLEVRVGNTEAQQLYRRAGYMVVQRISRYYNNGEDCFLMMKAIV
ncbi:MAG TPA: ribosomal protein S18-alanine N-acetyltransferase [Pyrinomonadaceae bacterium]|jgi:ribosomal-protein-alanine N-acetyltransferase|nr:ribosomal protein S18-alanine N-acetyltransferase [Pyrinomonadaceae bacterium]